MFELHDLTRKPKTDLAEGSLFVIKRGSSALFFLAKQPDQSGCARLEHGAIGNEGESLVTTEKIKPHLSGTASNRPWQRILQGRNDEIEALE